MAEQLNEWPKDIKKGWGSPRQSNKLYNWNLWLNGDVWEITQGKDFTGDVEVMRKHVNFAAKRRNLKVRTTVPRDKNTIIFQVISNTNGSTKK